MGLAFSRDGKLVAAAGSRNGVIWDVRTRRLLRVIPVGKHGTGAITFDPNGRTFAIGRSVGGDGVASVFDLHSGARVDAFTVQGASTASTSAPMGGSWRPQASPAS
jgi:WD40 repeat protein